MKFNPLPSRLQKAPFPNGMATVGPGQPADSQFESTQQNQTALLLSLMEELQRDMQATRSEIGGLKSEFQEVATQQDVQHKMFDALHTELSDYKNDFVSARMKPMLSAMLFLYDAISGFQNELEAYVDPPDWLGDKVLNKGLVGANLIHFQEQFDEILRMCELEPIQPEVGTVADPKQQNIIAAEPTEDAELNNHIQKVVRLGWMQGDKVFRPAEVIIWKAESEA